MSRITEVHYDAAGRVTGRTVTSRSGCWGWGCTAMLLLFVVTAPAYYAGQGNWPLGWPGAVLAYLFLAVLLIGVVATSVNRGRTAPASPVPGRVPPPTGGPSGPTPPAPGRPSAPP